MTQESVNPTPQVNSCPEFPYFGARYPDARCINGYLWDMDSYDDGYFTIGGEEPCPFCNTEEYLEQSVDEENPREEVLKNIEYVRRKYS
ncbi:hypothetical protein GGR92_000027 [Spirosoma lacussanchae]|uniref:hypothetical protein n=1 Tax=Spirosoma lacussanchae TaxID=1884249 RepID=UPI0011098266|nr:hypothetical protein [Spirosoma lacussanchae]